MARANPKGWLRRTQSRKTIRKKSFRAFSKEIALLLAWQKAASRVSQNFFMKYKVLLLLLITLIAGYLRFRGLGVNPLWVDEVGFGFLVQNGGNQEFIPKWFGQLFGLHSEFGLRFLPALCGTLTVPAFYFVANKYKFESALFVAVFPLFVFWSRMARPYAVAGLFLVLSWRYWWMMIPAVMTTPIALVGVRLNKWTLGLISIGVLFFFIRPDAFRGWSISLLRVSTRWWYLPALTLILYITNAEWKKFFLFWRSAIVPSPTQDYKQVSGIRTK